VGSVVLLPVDVVGKGATHPCMLRNVPQTNKKADALKKDWLFNETKDWPFDEK
jgi:hypothetical protein